MSSVAATIGDTTGNSPAATARKADAACEPLTIALVGNDDFSMFHFRAGIIRALLAANCRPVIYVPDGPYVGRLEALGVPVKIIPLQQFISPVADIRFVMVLAGMFRRDRPAIVHTMTVKPNIFGTFAARLAGVKKTVGLVSGAGYLFTPSTNWREALSKFIAQRLYAAAMRLCDRVWFQNRDDLEEFAARGFVRREKGLVILGSGVDTERFSPTSVPAGAIEDLRRELGVPAGNRCIVLVAARMIWSKGIGEFLAAARANETARSNWTFVLLAPRDEGTYDAVDPEKLKKEKPGNLIVVDRFRDDVERFVALGDIAVLPSFYREGVPRSLLEAMAMGKPIVAADAPGTREVIFANTNGFLVPPQDERAFTEALAKIMDDAELRQRMGTASRQLALQHFDEKIVTARVLDELYGLPAASSVPAH